MVRVLGLILSSFPSCEMRLAPPQPLKIASDDVALWKMEFSASTRDRNAPDVLVHAQSLPLQNQHLWALDKLLCLTKLTLLRCSAWEKMPCQLHPSCPPVLSWIHLLHTGLC